MPDYSKIIEDLRTKRGMTLQEIADKIGVDIKSVGNYKKGIEPRGRETKARLAELHATGDVSAAEKDDKNYEARIIQLQETLLKTKTASEIEAEIEGYRIKIKDDRLLSLLSFLAIQSRLDAFSDLLLMVAGKESPQKIKNLKKAIDESETKALSELLHKLKFLGAIDF